MKPSWGVEFDDRARRELRKLDKHDQHDILRFLRERISTGQNPRRFGKALGGDRWGLWRYRVGDYRIICRIEGHRLMVLVVHVGHRKNVYK